MIENNPTNLVAALEMPLEEIEAEIEFTNKVGARAFEACDYGRGREALERPPRCSPSEIMPTGYAANGITPDGTHNRRRRRGRPHRT